MVVITPDRYLLARFNALRAELADLAYELECQGRCDAADITNDLRIRLAEFAQELAPAGPGHTHPNKLSETVILSATKDPVRQAAKVLLDSSLRSE